MSEIKSDNKQLQLLVESIALKMNSSPALNGGFDRMLVMVEHIQEKQEETSDKVDKIHEGLYDPHNGLYARVKMIESATETFGKNHAAIATDLKKLSATDEDLTKKAETTSKLKKIAGDDLEKLESVIKVKSAWSDIWTKIIWFVVGGGLAAVGKAIWDAVAHR